MNKEDMKVSVIICAYTMERFKDVLEVVDSVLGQSSRPFETIVTVDHNEELQEKLRAELPGEVKVIANTGNHGLSDNRNEGIRAASGDIIAFIDDDAVANPHWLENLTSHFNDSQIVAVGGKAVPQWLEGDRPNWFPEEFDWVIGCSYAGMPVNGREVRNVPGCNMAFRKSVFDEIGYFRSDIGGIGRVPRGGEETELCLRIKAGVQNSLIIQDNEALIFHKVPTWRMSVRYLAQRSYNEGFYKSKVEKLASPLRQKSLSTENHYLKYLINKSFGRRLARFYKHGHLQQMAVLVVGISSTLTGYLVGRVINRN